MNFFPVAMKYVWHVFSNCAGIFPAGWHLPCFHGEVHRYLNTHLPDQWVGQVGLISSSSRSSNLIPPDFFVWGFVEDNVYFPPLPAHVDDLQARIHCSCKSHARHAFSHLGRN
jgi:hypothetical protein